ncbi:hypothetical protein PLEOSDRAFT_1091676 [Pleurotus ostreatus PC15]|uniref:ribonuclease T2 n=1 Tax=Pleurotus ostreatus (strain PC15) TaxID=1137138 RepID=A0A067PBX0_PLEO1|nr:hypothetical protein PLEOSDRAFT_1091676 [Pleurotus ostreatus PC15]
MLTVLFAASLLTTSSLAGPISDAGRSLGGLVDSPALFPRGNECSASGNLPTSCGNTTAVENLCCFEHPGGLLLQTQFWDTEPANGPADSWTIHGLWPDRCDGTYDSFCDPSRDYKDISQVLNSNDASDTLNFMKEYWLDRDGDHDKFWKHEWSKHGTCMSTIKPTCLSDTEHGADAAAYFDTTVKLFKDLPTHKWLADAGILPTDNQTFTYDALAEALKKGKGVSPRIDCKDQTLKEVVWYFNVKGSAMAGEFIPIDAPEGKKGSCPKDNIKYTPKSTKAKGKNPKKGKKN